MLIQVNTNICMSKDVDFFPESPLRQRVLELLQSVEDFGGPQSISDLCKNFQISNGSSRSVVVRLHKLGKIERIEKGIYRIKGDSRPFNKNKTHLK